MTPTVTPPTQAIFAPVAPVAASNPPPAVLPAPAVPSSRPASGWTRHKWTVDEYRNLGDVPSLRNMKVMLLDGEIYTMASPLPPHDTALALTEEYLRAVFTSGHHVRAQKGFDVGTRYGPEPDLAVVPGAIRDYATKSPTTAVLVVEVSYTTLATDTTTKAEVYATAGVPDYWVVDVEGRNLRVYRKPAALPEGLGATAYRSHEVYGPDESVAPLAAPDKPVKVADLLP